MLRCRIGGGDSAFEQLIKKHLVMTRASLSCRNAMTLNPLCPDAGHKKPLESTQKLVDNPFENTFRGGAQPTHQARILLC
jgi:hypothetical protein